MQNPFLVSVVIPTYNRRELLLQALDSVFAQTRPVDEVLVLDDGSTDGTGEAIGERFGEWLGGRLRYVWQPNAGVSAARNRGMQLARGRYVALLDSDDAWLPHKTALQLAWLEARPTFGMVLCDVERVDDEQNSIDVFHRRDVIATDGWVLPWVLQNPSLVPASAMLRREVFEDVGGFDESLATAEDLDFHLRVAARWRIGVVEQVLVRVVRGQHGLSALAQTYDDYVAVMERAVAAAAGTVDDATRQQALASAYARNARGMLIRSRWRDAWELAAKAWRVSPQGRGQLLDLAPFALRRLLHSAIARPR